MAFASRISTFFRNSSFGETQVGKQEHHLWSKRDSYVSGQKALNLVRILFADMEELGLRPDEDTTKKVAHAFRKQGQEDKQKEVIKRYLGRWKYIHFNGERV